MRWGNDRPFFECADINIIAHSAHRGLHLCIYLLDLLEPSFPTRLFPSDRNSGGIGPSSRGSNLPSTVALFLGRENEGQAGCYP